ncbi:branched-chain amino acid ABC transporter permease [Cuneatibacter sp. NSJ-177]|uniref:branched-chain amino acid ABC transporter permease n=1 Tax=Cuneatibacter sp. NSJ-177 TaxID=2931401 RepID=UPI001FD62843|nr:branched-chain amino acid ABC transporter permease [Cuneatibacter sp. NSJ-177]MCJ7834619.1 branched-chain amino acid ABC transporter permease [Cuneatibacter sp. NSJ-177]
MLAQQIVNGLVSGCIIALIALGYTMVYGVMRMINFAHASIFMSGSMFAWFMLKGLHVIEGQLTSETVEMSSTSKILVFLLVSVAAAAFCALLGLALERLAYRPLQNASRLSVVIAAMAAGMTMDNVAMLVSGGSAKGFPMLLPSKTFTVAGANVTSLQIFIGGITIGILLLLTFIVHRTYMGRAIRAVSEDRAAASLMGVNVNRVIQVVFILGPAIAGISAVLYSMYYGQSVYSMGSQVATRAWIAAVVGGIGSIRGSVAGAMLLGLMETIGSGYLPLLTNGVIGSEYSKVFALILLMLVLLFRPQGLFGEPIKGRS